MNCEEMEKNMLYRSYFFQSDLIRYTGYMEKINTYFFDKMFVVCPFIFVFVLLFKTRYLITLSNYISLSRR